MASFENELVTPLPPHECLRRLEAATTADTFFAGWRMSKTVLLRRQGETIRLRLHKPFVKNSFARLLHIRCVPNGSGTRLLLRSRMHPFGRAFMTVWFSGAIGVPIVGIGVGVIQGRFSPWMLGAILPALLVPLAGLGMVKFGERIGRHDTAEMTALVVRETAAKTAA